MRRGTTPIFSFTLPFNTDVIAVAKVTFKQGEKIVLEKKTKDCSLDNDVVSVKLTQEETFLFECKEFAEYQLRILDKAGNATETEVYREFVSECLDEEVLKEVEINED